MSMAPISERQHLGRPIVTRDDPKSPAAEAFRTLRTNLQFSGLDRPLRTLLITSAGPGEGKTTISANLAVAVAQSGSKVILMGADLRRPAVHSAMGASNAVGVTSVLTGHVSWEDALQPTEIEGLYLLPSGPIPPNPAELLASQRMSDLVDQLKAASDMLIIDAPPVIAVTDAGVLSRLVDGTLLVVSAGITPREIAKAAKEQLQQVGARILGIVVNRLDEESGYYYYYYRHYYATDGEHASRSFLGRLLGKLFPKVRRRTPAVTEVAAGRDD